MKKLFFLIILLLCTTFIFSEPITDNGDHLVTFRISKLVGKGFKDEICIQNGSSYLLKNIQLRITIDGKNHRLLPIDQVKSGGDDNFDGLEDDEMHDELKHFFGEKGKLTKNNTNKISFEFSFGDNNEKVLLKEYHIRDNELYFFVENNPDSKITKETIEDKQNVIYCGDKLTQMMLIPVFHDEYIDIDEEEYNKIMANSKRGDKGFGSSDIKH